MADFNPNPPRLMWTNVLFGFSGAGLIVMLPYARGMEMLGVAILWSIALLQFYRTVLLLFSFGAKEAWAGMRKWKVKHWVADERPHSAGQGE